MTVWRAEQNSNSRDLWYHAKSGSTESRQKETNAETLNVHLYLHPLNFSHIRKLLVTHHSPIYAIGYPIRYVIGRPRKVPQCSPISQRYLGATKPEINSRNSSVR